MMSTGYEEIYLAFTQLCRKCQYFLPDINPIGCEVEDGEEHDTIDIEPETLAALYTTWRLLGWPASVEINTLLEAAGLPRWGY